MSIQNQIPRQLFASSILAKENLEPKLQTQNDREEPILTNLKESLYAQEKERIKNKYQRTLKAKQVELQQLTKRYEKMEEEMKKMLKMNQTLTKQNEALQEKYTRSLNDFEHKQATFDQKYALQARNHEQQVNTLKNLISKLTEDLKAHQQRYTALTKQHKISMRRSNTALEEARSQLQTKLSIKQKQQEKIQALFEQKKQEYNAKIDEKDEEITCLIKELQQAKKEYEKLEMELNSFQNQKIADYREFQKEVKAMEAMIEQTKQSHTYFVQKITESLHHFKENLGLNSFDDDIFTLIDKMQEQLMNRKQIKQQQQKINNYELQIQTLKKSEKELINKNRVLQEQISFIRAQNIKNNQFADIIKSHIQHLDNKIQADKIQSFVKSSKIIEKSSISSILPMQAHQSNELMPMTRIKQSNPIKNNTEKSIDICLQKSKTKSTNDFLKEELQNKKKSLIYLMYRPSDEKQNNYSQAAHSISKQIQASAQNGQNRRRSNSLGNLISAKCREQMI